MAMTMGENSRETAQRMKERRGEDVEVDETSRPADPLEGTADDLLSSEDVTLHKVFVPACNKYFHVREMRANEKDEYEQAWLEYRQQSGNADGFVGFRAFLVAWSVTDSEGRRLFSRKDVHKLGNQVVGKLDPLVQKALEVNRLSEKDVDDLVGNSESVQPDDSPTG